LVETATDRFTIELEQESCHNVLTTQGRSVYLWLKQSLHLQRFFVWENFKGSWTINSCLILAANGAATDFKNHVL